MAFGIFLHVATLTDPDLHHLKLSLLWFCFTTNLADHLPNHLPDHLPTTNHPLTIPLMQDLQVKLLEDLGIEVFVKLSHELVFQPNLHKCEQQNNLSKKTFVLNVSSSCTHFPLGWMYLSSVALGGLPKKTRFLGYLSQMWVGGVADSQTRSKPLKIPPNCPENRLFRPKFHLSFSQISQKPWGWWVGKQIWERYPKKKGFFWQLPLAHCCTMFLCHLDLEI